MRNDFSYKVIFMLLKKATKLKQNCWFVQV